MAKETVFIVTFDLLHLQEKNTGSCFLFLKLAF